MYKQKETTRHGSIYLVTLITVTAIVSMVLIGVSLRSSSNVQSALIEGMSEGSNGILNASEYAFEVISSDPLWRITAQSGKIFNQFTIGDLTYTGSVTDSGTGIAPTYTTSTYRVKVSSATGLTASSAQVDLFANEMGYSSAYLTSLSALHYWPLDEDSNPALAVDLINAKDGSYRDTSVAGAGMNDEAGLVPVFAGLVGTPDHIEVPWAADFEQANGSISLWMNCTGPDSWRNYAILGMEYVLNGMPVICINVKNYGVKVYLEDTGNYNSSNFVSTVDDFITPGTWYHVVATWGVDGLRLYVDGVLKSSDPTNTDGVTTAKLGDGGQQPLHIGGGYGFFMSIPFVDGFEGSVAHVVFFKKQLTAVEVAELAAIKPDLLQFTLVNDSWVRVFE